MSGTVKKSKVSKPDDVASDTDKAKAKAEQEALDRAADDEEAKVEQEALDKAEAEANALEKSNKGDQQNVQVDETQVNDSAIEPITNDLHILGAFEVRAKSDVGFWRSGVQFHRHQEKLVLVVGEEPNASERVSTQNYESECVVLLTSEKAQRVHDEPNLIVKIVELEDVLDLQFMQQ